MEDELLELWNLIQKKQDKMNRHAETCERCERQLHRYQQQLHQLSEEYNFLMSQRPIQYSQNLFEEVKNPNRARLDLAANQTVRIPNGANSVRARPKVVRRRRIDASRRRIRLRRIRRGRISNVPNL